MLYAHETNYNPCCAEAWVGIRVDWRTGHVCARICPKCHGSSDATKEAKRLHYVVDECLCGRHTAEEIAIVTNDRPSVPFFLEPAS